MHYRTGGEAESGPDTMLLDGEFRRATWHLDFMWGSSTASAIKKTNTGLPFHGEGGDDR